MAKTVSSGRRVDDEELETVRHGTTPHTQSVDPADANIFIFVFLLATTGTETPKKITIPQSGGESYATKLAGLGRERICIFKIP